MTSTGTKAMNAVPVPIASPSLAARALAREPLIVEGPLSIPILASQALLPREDEGKSPGGVAAAAPGEGAGAVPSISEGGRKYGMRVRRAPEHFCAGEPEPVAVKKGSRALPPKAAAHSPAPAAVAPARLLRSQLPPGGREKRRQRKPSPAKPHSRKEGEQKEDKDNGRGAKKDDNDDSESTEDDDDDDNEEGEGEGDEESSSSSEEHEPVIVDGTELPEKVLFLRCSKLKKIVAEKTAELNLEKKKLKELVERLTPRVHKVNEHTREKDTVINTKGVNFLLQKKKPKAKKPQDVAFDHCKKFFLEKGQNASEADIKRLVQNIFDKKGQPGAGEANQGRQQQQQRGQQQGPDNEEENVEQEDEEPALKRAAAAQAAVGGGGANENPKASAGRGVAAGASVAAAPVPAPESKLHPQAERGEEKKENDDDNEPSSEDHEGDQEPEPEPEYKVELRLDTKLIRNRRAGAGGGGGGSGSTANKNKKKKKKRSVLSVRRRGAA